MTMGRVMAVCEETVAWVELIGSVTEVKAEDETLEERTCDEAVLAEKSVVSALCTSLMTGLCRFTRAAQT